MGETLQEFNLTTQAKLIMLAVLLIFGVPILYAALLQFQSQEPLMGALMVGLFILFVLVLFIATGYKIKITDSALHRDSLLNSTTLKFSEVEAIHFGSSWTNFHVQSGNEKIFVTKDFEEHEQIIQHIVDSVQSAKNLDEVEFTGKSKQIEEHTISQVAG